MAIRPILGIFWCLPIGFLSIIFAITPINPGDDYAYIIGLPKAFTAIITKFGRVKVAAITLTAIVTDLFRS